MDACLLVKLYIILLRLSGGLDAGPSEGRFCSCANLPGDP